MRRTFEETQARKLKWDKRFMALARHVALWSKDPSTKVGAVIVNRERKVLGLGFNGFAMSVDDSPEAYLDRDSKLGKVIHAETNAILDASQPLQGTTVYISCMPCPACVALLIQVGIDRVVVPTAAEDPFSYRGDDDAWTAKIAVGAKDLRELGIELNILLDTNYDVELLMGPEHPYIKKIASQRTREFY